LVRPTPRPAASGGRPGARHERGGPHESHRAPGSRSRPRSSLRPPGASPGRAHP
jgi:hypothetical protein